MPQPEVVISSSVSATF